MSFTSWLSESLGLSRTRERAARAAAASKRPTFRPMFEALEDRWVLSTLTVLNNLDSGAGSLRAEITAAHKSDTIVFAPSLAGKTITLTSGELLIDKNLIIVGPGAGILTVSGGETSRVFEVAKGKQVDVSGLTISNGQAAEAGGILNHGTLTLSGSAISGNSAAGSIYVAGSGVGGGIQNFGTLTVSGSTLSGNSSSLGGGAIANNGGSTLTLSDCTLFANTAVNDGGGINNDGMATISASTLSGNSSTSYSGGGIANAGTLTISNTILSGNSANNSIGGGGGIFNDGSLTVGGSTLSDNSARSGGGILTAGPGKATITNSTLTGNVASYGGGIYVTGGTLTLSKSTLSGNSAALAGGGIFIARPGTVTVKNSSSITGNTAPIGVGADIDNLGVLYLDRSSTIGVLDGNPAMPI
jgi:hypothetical protein